MRGSRLVGPLGCLVLVALVVLVVFVLALYLP